MNSVRVINYTTKKRHPTTTMKIASVARVKLHEPDRPQASRFLTRQDEATVPHSAEDDAESFTLHFFEQQISFDSRQIQRRLTVSFWLLPEVFFSEAESDSLSDGIKALNFPSENRFSGDLAITAADVETHRRHGRAQEPHKSKLFFRKGGSCPIYADATGKSACTQIKSAIPKRFPSTMCLLGRFGFTAEVPKLWKRW